MEGNVEGDLFCGVDIGSKGIRVVFIDKNGNEKGCETGKINLFHEKREDGTSLYYQKSKEIWNVICVLVKNCISKNKLNKNNVRSIGFTATCSLVMVIKEGEEGEEEGEEGEEKVENDVISWMCHRAKKQTMKLNLKLKENGNKVLKSVGGAVSVEMQTPKLMWLKEKENEIFSKCSHFFDLCDWCNFKACGSTTRSLCPLRCKWGYVDEQGWDNEYWKAAGLDCFLEEKWSRIGDQNNVKEVGEQVGTLSSQSALQLGLHEGVLCCTGLIDAHAGALSILGAKIKEKQEKEKEDDITSRLAIISGTSCCFMSLSKERIECNGVWGPYFGVIFPGFWCLEGGQSCAGSAIEHVLKTNENEDISKIIPILHNELKKIAKNEEIAFLSKDVNILPLFHGSRLLQNSELKGIVIDGIETPKCIRYLSCIQGLCFEAKKIMNKMEIERKKKFKKIILIGGLSNDKIYIQTLSDILQLPIYTHKKVNSAVAQGAAILGAFSFFKKNQNNNNNNSIISICSEMSNVSPIPYLPRNIPFLLEYYKKKEKIFDFLTNQQISLQKMK